MRRLVCALIVALALLSPMLAQQPQSQPDQLREAWARMSKVQALLEYFFMEQGQYPESLAELERAFNTMKPKSGADLVIPKDPGTGKSFVYLCKPPFKKYALSIPDPAAYGGQSFTLPEVDWGFMARLAEQRRTEQIALQCGFNLKGLATQTELFAKDHNKTFPKSLDEMFPKYISRYPQCPASGKNYLMTSIPGGYLLSCPTPERHGLKQFRYHSQQGMQIEETSGARPVAPSPAPSP